MGNKILGRRSRNFYKGFNQRQLAYLRDKFESLSQAGTLKRELFIGAYMLDDSIFNAFSQLSDFDDQSGVDEYEFICMASYLCNLSAEQLGRTLFSLLPKKAEKINEAELEPFTRVCLRYNAYLEGKEVKDSEIRKANKQKFKKYDYDKSKSVDCGQFTSICLKDADYKNWLYNMGFITKNQMDFQDQVYDLVDSDIGEEVQRQLRQPNPNVDRIKRGIESRQADDEFKPQNQIGQQSSKPVDKPWLAGLQKLKAEAFTDQSVPSLSQEPPSQLLTLDHVLGYRSFDCRNNLRFDSKDQIIYHQAALGIVLTHSKQGRQYDQIYLNEHKDDITCLDNAGDRVVTGEAGTLPMIVVWNTNTLQNGALKSQFIITKNLKESVGNVCFSPSQKYIAATCNDADHSLVVYDLQQLKKNESDLTSTKTGIVCSGPLVKCLIFDIRFEEGQQSLVVATIKELLFVSIEKGVINSSRGDFVGFSPTMALSLLPLSVSAAKGQKREQMIAGMGNGSIYFWQKGKCVKALVGHSGSVSVLTKRVDCNSFISGDKTGRIIFWNDAFVKQREISLPKTNSPSNMVVSLCQGSKKQLLIGTKGSNILLLNNGEGVQKAKVVASGHSDGTVWSAAVSEKYLFTGGEDQRLIKWDYTQSKKAVAETKCPYKIRSLDFNAKNQMLAVGFLNGLIHFYNPGTLQRIQKFSYSKIKNPDQQALSIVRFQNYGRMLAACYNTPKPRILLFTCDKDLKLIGQLELRFRVISFDLTISDKEPFHLRCNSLSPAGQTYELYEITTEKEKAKFKAVTEKIVKSDWQSHTCAFSPQTRAIISEGIEQKDITCVARGNRYRNVIVAGDRFSKLKLFNYPCPFNKIYNKYEGHSNSVTALLFSPKEDYLISIGGEEKAIFIWKYDPVLIKNSYVVDRLDEEQDNEFAAAKVKGDQSLSTPQYKGQVFAPKQFAANRKDNKVPDQTVKIKHAFGIRNSYVKDQVRNQGKLTLDCRSILFPTACLAIKMDIETKQQQIFLQHKEDIVSFAVDRQRKLMATGQMAQKNLLNPLKKILSIYVWDVETRSPLAKLDGFHTIAVVLLQFSPSGKLLFSCGNDEKNTFAVYDWRAKTVLYSGPVSRAKVNGIAWKSESEFATCGNDHVKFWQNGKGRLGEFSPAKTQAQFCIANSGSIYISGGGLGNLFVWSGNKAPASLKAHSGKVQCLVDRKNYVYSGGDDGIILRWRKKGNGSIEQSDLFLDCRTAFPEKKLPKETQYGILSLDFGPDSDETYLFITKGCAAIVNQRGKFKKVTQGHYDGELWGLAGNTKSDVFVTGGDDGSLRLWSISKREQVMRTDCDRWIRAVDWSNSGDKIVYADSYCKIRLLDSSLNLLSEYSGQPANKNKKGSGWIEQIKFSPNSQLVAYGTHGKSQTMQFLKVEGKKISLLNSFNSGITSALLHIDWSRDSEAISINTQAAQLLFYTLSTKGKCSSASVFRDEKWATWTQKFGFPVQGIFQGPDYSDVNTVCRDPLGSFLAVGYDDQTIRLFKYPCYIPKQVHKTYYGHSSHVTRVRFTPNYMVSTGGLDRTILVWQIERAEEREQKRQEEESGDQLSDLDEEVDLPRKLIAGRKKKKRVEEDFREVEAEGDEFMAVKPWLGAIKEPTYPYPKQTSDCPNADINLEYVHGYRTKDCRQNLYFNDDKTLIYHAAAVLIYHDTKQNSQKLLTDHHDDILSIDYHKSSGGVITGELGPKPLINYYKDSKLMHTFKAAVSKGVLALAISPDGTKAVAAGMDDDHWVAVLDLKKGTVVGKQKGGKKVILKLGWLSEEEFVSVGIRHFKYWTLDGNKLTGKDGNQPANFVSLAIASDKTALTGASAGTIYAWKGKSGKLATTLKRPAINQKADENQQASSKVSVVQSLSVQKGFIAAGTKDGFIFILSQKYETTNVFTLQEILLGKGLKSEHPAVRSLDFKGSKMLVGTLGSQIFQLQVDNLPSKEGKVSRATCHMKGHYSPNNTWTNQVWGLHVDGDLVFSCSDDATVRCWSIEKRVLESIASLNLIQSPKTGEWIQSPKDDKTNDFYDSSKGRSVCVSPDRRFITVGCKEGTVRIFRFDQKTKKIEMFQKFRHAQQWISQIKFGFNLLIIGSHDNGIYVYDYDADDQLFKRKYRPMRKHSSYITHFDVSRDSCYLQSTCGAYQLLFWDLNTGKQITSGASMLRDQRWATWTCTLGWPVQGIYPKCTDGTFIHSVDRSGSSLKGGNWKDDPKTPYLLAGGNNNGQICIYNFPCTIKNSQYAAGVGHSSHVTNVRWSDDDQRIISVGGEDQCLMYWRVKKDI